MLQQFYKDTLQSNYIKYILNNSYIPTVPFTSNILHVTKGNTYIHEGYFVTAKISDAVDAIREDILNNPELYDKYFIKHSPYVFGAQYYGLTTSYLSNVKGYDPTTHYYLGEYLRAYKAHYNIDLMSYYNCFSNEYIDYLSLSKDSNSHKIVLNEYENQKFTIISVPIKFCQRYTIAIQCSQEVNMLPVFIGNKGLLKDVTEKLNKLNYWGKSYTNLNFKKPIIFESPHINSISDTTQAMLQTYDKYLRLLIQIPRNLKSSIVVLEGDFHNISENSTRIINTDKEEVNKLYSTYYTTKIPYIKGEGVNIPKDSTLICKEIERQKLYRDYENIPIKYGNESFVKFEIANSEYFKLKAYTKKVETTNNNNVIKIPLNNLIIPKGNFGSNYKLINEQTESYYRIKILNESVNKNNIQPIKPDDNDNDHYYINKSSMLEIEKSLLKQWDANTEYSLIQTLDDNGKSLYELIVKIIKKENDTNEINFYIRDLFCYLKPQHIIDGDITIALNNKIIKNSTIKNNSLIFEFNDIINPNIIITSNPLYENDSTYYYDNWELKTQSFTALNDFTNYLNKNMYSNLSLLQINNTSSYAFSGRLIEYLLDNVISSNDEISNNIKRVQIAANKINGKVEKATGIWEDALRVDVFKAINKKAQQLDRIMPLDINGFIDKDSEKLLNIENKIN